MSMPSAAQPAAAEKILVVDDDRGIRDVLAEFLTRHGYEVETVADGAEMDRALARSRPDLVVLDLMLPGENGLSICRRLAGRDRPPVVMLSAMGEDTDKIVGLELGADDYLAKPCNPRELLARIRAVLRRRGEGRAGEPAAAAALEFCGWRLDLVRRELRSAEGLAVGLSNGEFHLLRALAERPMRVLSRDQLLDLARGEQTEQFDRSIDVQVSRLRRKLAEGSGADPIRTVRGEGYMFDAEVARR
jgi:two-component system OmpR family response regulator